MSCWRSYCAVCVPAMRMLLLIVSTRVADPHLFHPDPDPDPSF
jgi:hypothetical protein